ncbi:MAG: chemotaxis protein CheB, partial [Actinomycetota bacterium]
AAVEREEPPGKLSGLSCPECAGPLYELHDGSLVRYRCRVGHAYTADSVLEEKDEALESALYLALNTLEESAQLSERLAARSRVQNHLHAAERFEERAREARQRATLIRRVLTGPPETTV